MRNWLNRKIHSLALWLFFKIKGKFLYFVGNEITEETVFLVEYGPIFQDRKHIIELSEYQSPADEVPRFILSKKDITNHGIDEFHYAESIYEKWVQVELDKSGELFSGLSNLLKKFRERNDGWLTLDGESILFFTKERGQILVSKSDQAFMWDESVQLIKTLVSLFEDEDVENLDIENAYNKTDPELEIPPPLL